MGGWPRRCLDAVQCQLPYPDEAPYRHQSPVELRWQLLAALRQAELLVEKHWELRDVAQVGALVDSRLANEPCSRRRRHPRVHLHHHHRRPLVHHPRRRHERKVQD